MQILTILLLSLLPALRITATPISGQGLGEAVEDAKSPHEKTTCSANQSGSIPDWAANPAWASSMKECLEELDNDGWNGAECQPSLAGNNSAPLGSEFRFL